MTHPDLLPPWHAVTPLRMRLPLPALHDLEIGLHGFDIHTNITSDVGIVDDFTIRLGGNLQKPPERIPRSDQMFRPHLLFEVGQRIGPQ